MRCMCAGRRGRAARTRARARQLSPHRTHHRGRPQDRRGGDPPRLRLPVRERRIRAGLPQKPGIVFIGPTAEMMTAMGSKSAAKALMEKAGVPLVPGYHGEAQDEATLAQRRGPTIGFRCWSRRAPAAAAAACAWSNGGRASRPPSVGAKREAKAAFGDDRVLIEKLRATTRAISRCRSSATAAATSVSLFERECTAAAPAPEGDRGSAVADPERQSSERAAVSRRAKLRGAVELCRRGHHRVRLRRQGRLLHRDEHAPAGRAPGHRADHRRRSGRMAAASRLRRSAATEAERDQI